MKAKKIFVLIALLLCSLILVGCKEKNDGTYTQPNVTNGNEIAFEANGYSFTKQEVYNSVKYNGGLTILLQQLDEQLLNQIGEDYSEVKAAVDAVTTDSEVFKAKKQLMINESGDENDSQEVKADEFNKTMALLGYKSEDEINGYILTLAKRDAFAKAYLENADKYSEYNITDEKLENFYNTNNQYDKCTAIVISYDSIDEFKAALEDNNYAIYDSELYKVTNSDIPKRQRSEGNGLEKVTDVLSVFVDLYNKKNAASIAANIKVSMDATGKEYQYDELNANASTLAKKLFALDANSEIPYTYFVTSSSTGMGTKYSVIYKINNGTVKEYSQLTETEKKENLEAYLSEYVSEASNVSSILAEYRKELGIKFYDKEFGYDYNYYYDSELVVDNIKSKDNVLVECDGITITADSFYDYATKLSKEYYVLYASVIKIAQNYEISKVVYGSEQNYEKNGSLRKSSFYDEVQEIIDENYTEDTYGTLANYLYQNAHLNTIDDVVKENYASTDYKYLTILNNLFEKDENGDIKLKDEYVAKFNEVIGDYKTKHYDVNAYDLKVSIDADDDYKADDLENASTEVQALIAEVKTFIDNQTKDITSYSTYTSKITTIVSDFNSVALNYTDDTEKTQEQNEYYAKLSEFKNKGIVLTFGQMSYTPSTSSSAVTNLVWEQHKDYASEDIVQELMNMYNEMAANTDSVVGTSYRVSANFLFEEDGAHLIVCKYRAKRVELSYSDPVTESEGQGETESEETEEEKVEYNKLAYSENEAQFVAGMFYYNVFINMLGVDDADEAAETYGITEFPLAYPESIDIEAITDVLEAYFLSGNFLNATYSEALGFTGMAEIYNYFFEGNNN